MTLLTLILLTWAACTHYASPYGQGWDCTAERSCPLVRALQQYAGCGHTICLQPGEYRWTQVHPITAICPEDAPLTIRGEDLSDDPERRSVLCAEPPEEPHFSVSHGVSHLHFGNFLLRACDDAIG